MTQKFSLNVGLKFGKQTKYYETARRSTGLTETIIFLEIYNKIMGDDGVILLLGCCLFGFQ